MLEITVPADEIYLPKENKFVAVKSCTLTLEHSLISIAKWEAKWHMPYLNAKKRTSMQELDYIRCMVVGPIKNDYVFSVLTPKNIAQIRAYMEDSMTATTFSKSPHSSSREVVTAETLYCRMFANNIPMECQKWHLNRLLTLIRVCDAKNGPRSKMSKRQTATYYAEQNALRRAKYNSRG
ncbi:MAG: hypothetical protein WCR04_12465 [Fibrobacteraceae bacterium]